MEKLSCLKNLQTYYFNYAVSMVPIFMGYDELILFMANQKKGVEFHLDGNDPVEFLNFSRPLLFLENKKNWEPFVINFFIAQTRNLISNSFEEAIRYNSKEFKNIEWYGFVKLLRNAFIHSDGVLKKNHNGAKINKCRWRNKVIDNTMNGENIYVDFFGYDDAVQLFFDIYNFVENTNERK